MIRQIYLTLFLLLVCSTSALATVKIKNNTVFFFIESDETLSFDQAKVKRVTGDFQKTTLSSLTFGINSNPVWLHLQIENHTNETETHRLVAGMTWIDYLDLYFSDSYDKSIVLKAGDRRSGAPYTVPGIGIAFDLQLTPGINNVFLRAETVDSIIFPIKLIKQTENTKTYSKTYIYYGLIYGFLIALIIINLMFFRVLGNKVYLYYSLALSSFVFINIGYTGYGIYFFWTDFPEFQNFAVLAFLVFYSILFLCFGRRFLRIDSTTPKISKVIKAYQWFGLILITVALLYNDQLIVGLVSYFYLATSAVGFLVLSAIFFNRAEEGKYFFAAVLAGMTGVITSDLVVIGILPYTDYFYHGAEIGITLESSILALALTRQIKARELARLRSQHLAYFDPLTDLHNRRSFYEIAKPLMEKADQDKTKLSTIMIDVDKFKLINDEHGHAIGDQTLKIISQRIKTQLRKQDIAVRWGGEEILIFLPETDIEAAENLAERIRKTIADDPLHLDNDILHMSISLGVASLHTHKTLDDLINTADLALLKAKQTGRNKTVVDTGLS